MIGGVSPNVSGFGKRNGRRLEEEEMKRGNQGLRGDGTGIGRGGIGWDGDRDRKENFFGGFRVME